MPPALITPSIPSIISFPLDPPPSYHSLFPSSESSDSEEAPRDPVGGSICLEYRWHGFRLGLGSSSPLTPHPIKSYIKLYSCLLEKRQKNINCELEYMEVRAGINSTRSDQRQIAIDKM